MSTLLDDTFTGGGNLTAHIADSGDAWALNPTATCLFCAAQGDLSLAGGLVSPGVGACGELLSDIFLGDTYTVEIDFVTTSANGISTIGVYTNADVAGGTFDTFQFISGFDGAASAAANFEIVAGDDTGASNAQYAGTGANADGAHTLIITVSPGSATIAYDGPTLLTISPPAKIGTGLVFFMENNPAVTSAIAVTRLTVTGPGGAFWTKFVKTVENA
jgi:hypothetical protein